MQTNTDHSNTGDTSVDAEELNQAQRLWHNFTLFIKWGIIACAIALILLGLITL